MTTQPLGRLTKVDLREYWQREATDFTPWLSRPENLALLAEAIGRELERQGEEVNVGQFRADLLCRDTMDGQLILVENQIEKTDHTHLGQILTYAAGLGAKIVVWIAREFQEDHRAALDWLNEHTGDDIAFYGVQVELWRIGDSAPAPRFDVVAHPNEWTRGVRETAKGAALVSETDQVRVAFWKSFGEYLKRNGLSRRPPSVRPHTFWSWGIGRTDFGLGLSIHPRTDRIAVYLNLGGGNAKQYFRALYHDREVIEKELVITPLWLEKPEQKESMIRIENDCDFGRPET